MKADNKTLKFLIFILAFLVIVMAFVFLFVIPSIKEFKHKKAEYYQQLKEQKHLAENEKKLQEKLRQLRKEHAAALESFKEEFQEDAFLKLAKKYFKNVQLTPKDVKKTESGLQIYEFRADFSASTPVQFYRFIDAVNRMKSVIKINFPIELEAQNSNISLKFNMSVYKL